EIDIKYLIKDTAYEYINKRIGGYCHINGLDGQGKISANITSSYSHNNTGNVIVIAKLKTKAHESTNRIYSKSGISPTLTCCCGGNLQPKILQSNKGSVKEICNTNNYLQNGDIVRRLTPKECLRLMDVSEKNIDKLLHCGISNSQLYKLAGNSIVV
ncbi:MAG: DNA cytosine methyltransferase, partial [Elusimicrobiales bacterium]|nr:DNA cytosine methyltransferase [Elusimicrobiales bacterium]